MDTSASYAYVIERAADGSYWAYLPDLPGCTTTGESPEAVERYVAASRLARWAIALGGIIAVGGVVVIAEHGSNLPRGLLVAGGLAVLSVLVVGLGATIVAPLRWFDLHLDGSGRWVTVQRAHPAFAAAVRQHNALAHAHRP